MEEGGVQTPGGVEEVLDQLIQNQEVIRDVVKLLVLLHRSGLIPFLVGILERRDEVLEFLSQETSRGNLLGNLMGIYSVLNGDIRVNSTPTLSELIAELRDPAVRRGLMKVIKMLRWFGGTAEEGES